jgi:hypothetical protein
MPHLPHELIDHIIGYFQDSVPDLLTCARVCKAWLEQQSPPFLWHFIFKQFDLL